MSNMYLVVVAHRDGAYIPESELKHTDRDTLCRHIREGQFNDILHVLELNLAAQTCKEATHEFRQIIDEDQRLRDRLRQGLPDDP